MAALAIALGLLVLAGGVWLVYNAGLAMRTPLEDGVAPQVFRFHPVLTVLGGFLLMALMLRWVFPLIFLPVFGLGMARGMRRHGWKRGPRRWHWDEGPGYPPFFKAWHDRAHNPEAADEDPQA
jgi:hypothetical protein